MSTTNLLTFPPETAAGSAAPDHHLAELRRDLASAGRKVWLAGLGLLGELADLDAASRRWVDDLAERGRPLAERQRRAAEELADRANARLSRAGRRLTERAREGAAGALARLGVPAREDVERLAARVAALSARIDEMTTAQAAQESAGGVELPHEP
jgi:poly(hydroxyalkanoate) granule-associated protein